MYKGAASCNYHGFLSWLSFPMDLFLSRTNNFLTWYCKKFISSVRMDSFRSLMLWLWTPRNDIQTFTGLWEVSIEHLRRVWHADRGCLPPPPGHLVLSYFDSHLFIKRKPHYLLVTLTEHYLFTEIERFLQNMCDGCGIPAKDADSSGHLVPSHLGLAFVPFVKTNSFPGLCCSNIPLYFLDFATYDNLWVMKSYTAQNMIYELCSFGTYDPMHVLDSPLFCSDFTVFVF